MLRWGAILLNGVVGFGAMSGSILALHPGARAEVGIDAAEMLVNSPFTTFLFPGLFLLLILGLGNLLVGFTAVRQLAKFPYSQCVMGSILCLWIMIQCVMLWAVVFLHVLFFIVGAIQLLLGIQQVRREKIPFPFSAHQN